MSELGIKIAPGIRVLEAGRRGWAVSDDADEYYYFFPTEAAAIDFATQRASDYAAENAEDPPDEPSLYEQADRATGAERKRLLALAARGVPSVITSHP